MDMSSLLQTSPPVPGAWDFLKAHPTAEGKSKEGTVHLAFCLSAILLPRSAADWCLLKLYISKQTHSNSTGNLPVNMLFQTGLFGKVIKKLELVESTCMRGFCHCKLELENWNSVFNKDQKPKEGIYSNAASGSSKPCCVYLVKTPKQPLLTSNKQPGSNLIRSTS